MIDKPDTLYLLDAKMELHSEEESFAAQPTILVRSNSSNRCTGVLIGGIVVVVGLIAGAFVAGYMIRSAVTRVSTDCKTNDKVSLSQIRLQDILALVSTKSIDHNLRLARQTTYVNLFFWYPNLSQSLFFALYLEF